MANQLATRDACSEGRAQACTCGCANAVEEVAEGRIEAGSGIFTCCRAAIGEKYARYVRCMNSLAALVLTASSGSVQCVSALKNTSGVGLHPRLGSMKRGQLLFLLYIYRRPLKTPIIHTPLHSRLEQHLMVPLWWTIKRPVSTKSTSTYSSAVLAEGLILLGLCTTPRVLHCSSWLRFVILKSRN